MAVANPDEFEVLPARPAYADPKDFELVSSPAQTSGPQSASPAATDQITAPKSAPITEQISALPETVTGALAETGLETASGYKAAQSEALRRADEKGKSREEAQDAERAQAAKIHDDLTAKLGLPPANKTAQAERDKLQRQLDAGPDESEQALEDAKALAEDAKARGETKAPGAVTTIARGLTKGAAMAAEAAIPGVGLPVMATQGATSAYGQAKSAGKSEHEAEDAGARTLIALAAFGGANKAVSSTITKLLGNAPALKVFLTQTFGQAAGNEATSRVISAYEAAAQAEPGKRMEAAMKAAKENDLGQIAQNLGFAVMGGAHEAGKAPVIGNMGLDAFAAQARAIPDSEFDAAIRQYRELPKSDPRKKVFEAEIVRRGEPDYVTSKTGTATQGIPGEPARLETPQGQDGQTVSQEEDGDSIEQIKAKMRAAKVTEAADALKQAADSAQEIAPASAAAAKKLSEALKAKAEQIPLEPVEPTAAPPIAEERKAPAEETAAPMPVAPVEQISPQGTIPQPPSDPSELTPAIKTPNGILTGENHPAIIEANNLDPSVRESPDAGFVDKAGNFFSREQVARVLPTEKPGEAHTRDLPKKEHLDALLDEVDAAPDTTISEPVPSAPNETPAPETVEQENPPPTAEINPVQKRVNDIQSDIAANTSAPMKWKRKRAKDLAAAQKELAGETAHPESVVEPEPESKEEIWQKSRAEMGDHIAKHTTFIKQAISDGRPVPLSVLMEYEGRAWAEKAIKNFSELEKAEAALESPYLRKQIEGELGQALEKDQMKRGSEESGASTLIPDIADKVVAAGRYSYRKGMQAAEWTASMLKAFEERVRPYLAAAWKTIAGDSEAGGVGGVGAGGGKKLGQGEERQAFIASTGKTALKDAITAGKEAKAAGWDQEDAINFAINHLRSAMREQGKTLDEEAARKFFSPAEVKTEGGDSVEKRNQEGDEKGRQKGVLEPPPGEGETVQSQSPDPGDHAAYNAATDKVLEKAGFAPIAKEAQKALGTSWNEALAAVDKSAASGQDLGGDMVNEMIANPRVAGDVEHGILLRELTEREKVLAGARERIAEAEKGDDEGEKTQAEAALNLARDRVFDVVTALKKTGTEWGRAGRFRQIHIDDDYNITSMETKVRSEVNKGKPLSEEQAAQVAASAEEIEKARKYDEAVRLLAEAQEVNRVHEATIADLKKGQEEPKKSTKAPKNPLSESIIETVRSIRNSALERIRARKGKMFADPLGVMSAVDFADHALVGATYIAEGAVTFGKWSSAMVKEFGDSIKPHLKLLYDASKEQAKKMLKEAEKKKEQTPVQAKAKVKAEAVAGEELSHKAVYELARAHISAGVHGEDAVMKAVHADIQEYFPDATERDVRRAFSQYGKVKFPSKEAVSAELREIRTLTLLQESIDRETAGLSALHTGLQRDKASQAIREKQKTLNELLKKRQGPPSPEKLASREEAKQTALKNAIADLDKQLRTGEKPEHSAPAPDSPHTEQLRSELGAMREKLREIERAESQSKTPEQISNDARVKALKKSIDSMDAQLKTGEKPAAKERIPDTPEVEQLRAERDAMREKLKEIEAESNPPKSDAEKQVEQLGKVRQRLNELLSGKREPKKAEAAVMLSSAAEDMQAEIHAMQELVAQMKRDSKPPSDPGAHSEKMAIKALEKSIEEYQRKTAEKDFTVKGKKLGPDSAKVAQLKEIRASRRAMYEAVRDSGKPVRTPDEIYNERYRKIISKRQADLEAKLAAGDFSKQVRNKRNMDRESEQAKADYERAKQKFNTEVEKQRLAKRTGSQKFWDGFVSVERAMKLTSAAVFGKLGVAAAARAGLTPIEEGVGAAISKALPGLAARAPREGGFSRQAEAKAFASMFTSGLKDAADNLKMRKSNLDALHGRGKMRDVPPAWWEYMGFLHSALKAPIKRAEFERSLAKRIEWARNEGQDITDPNVMAGLSQEAYVDANRAIFMQDNLATKGFSALQRIARDNKAPGAARLMEFLVPIVKVPTNIVSEAYEGTPISLLHAAGKTASAYMKGIESLPPAEGDIIMRQLKKGLIGTAALTFGYLAANNVGGFFRKGQKRRDDDLKPGEYRIGGKVMPKWFGHTPIAMLINIGATTARAARERERLTGEKKGIGVGAVEAAKGFAKEIPFVPAATNLIDALGTEGGTQRYVAEMIAGTAEPAILPQIARAEDTPGTFPKNILDPARQRKIRPGYIRGTQDALSMGIPVLRKRVPLKSTR